MTKEQALLWVAEAGMFTALGCFVRGWTLRIKDNARHQRLGRTGGWIVIGVLVVLEVLLRRLGWEFPVRSHPALYAHVTVASVAFTLLIVMWVSGARRARAVHVATHGWFLLAFTTSVVLSLFAFRLW